MKSTLIKSAGALLLGLFMTSALNAQPGQGGRGQGWSGSGDAYGHQFAKIELTEEQQEEITSLRSAHYKEITPLRNKMAELKARERTLLSEESVDMKAVNKAIDEQTDLMNSIRKLQVEQQVAVKSLLTDEQVMKLQQRREFARRDGFHGKGHSQWNGYRKKGGTGMGRGYRGI